MPNINTQGPPIESASNLKIFGMGQNGSVGWISSNTLDSYYNERMAEDFALIGTHLSVEELLTQRSYLIGVRNIFADAGGIWYDPQDLTTMYQDAQGTLSVYRPGTGLIDPPVGLMLDKSQGVELGPELWDGVLTATNGTSGANGVYDAETGELSNTVVGTLQYVPSFLGRAGLLEVNKFYRVRLKFSGNLDPLFSVTLHGGSTTPQFFAGGIGGGAIRSAGGEIEYIGTNQMTTPGLRINTDGTSIWSGLFIEEISVREIKGYHAYQPDTMSRPTLSGRYNLLTATDTLATQSVTTVATDYTLRFEGTGTVTLSGTATGPYSEGTHTITCTAGTLTCTVDGSVTKADLRVKRDDLKLPAYQAVVDADNYDTVRFPLFLNFDKVDDNMLCQVPAGGITGTFSLATTRGTANYGVIIPEGEWTLGNAYNPLGDVVSAVLVDQTLSDAEKALLKVFGIGKGGTEFGVETSFTSAYQEWTHLVDFPLIDTSSGTNFSYAWDSCSGLTSFPELDVSNGNNFNRAWFGCSGLTSFPALDLSSGTNFYLAWRGCSKLTSFPVLDVSSGINFTSTWNHCTGLTSFPELDVSSGTNFSYAWNACSGLTSFPVLDVSSGTNFQDAWRGCSGLTSFPMLDVSSGVTFTNAWYDCSGLTSFPALDVSSGTHFTNAWRGCSGLTSFPVLDTSSGITFQSAWAGSGLTSFPVLDVSSGINFDGAWFGCSGLTSFPELDVSSGDSFQNAWLNCSGLTSFPANFFDNCLATNFTGSFKSTNLSQESIDGILVSINSNATSNGTFDQSGGSAPSAAGEAAITEMRSRGWTVTVTGDF